jgi:hypothetical protein
LRGRGRRRQQIGDVAPIERALYGLVKNLTEPIGEGGIKLGMGEDGCADDDLAARIELAIRVLFRGDESQASGFEMVAFLGQFGELLI